MAKVQDLLEAAKGAIISGACDQAITVCDHILQRYPKHLEAHCLLAEAYREQGDLSYAEDLFLRCLSADPERLIARWALSIVYDRRGERDAAVKQLRIALELSPDHAELRRELAEMSSERLKPSTAGLARLYLRGGLFERSASEFRSALQLEPQRLDLRLGLAEVLWRDGRLDEALQQCHDILDDSPDCLKALAIATLVETYKPDADLDALLVAARALDPDDMVLSELARQSDVDVAKLRLLDTPVIVPDPEAMDIFPAPDASITSPEVSVPSDRLPSATAADEAEDELPAVEPSSANGRGEPEQRAARPDEMVSPAAGPAAIAPRQDVPRLLSDVPEWLAGDAKATADPKAADDLGEWASLLDEQIALDSEAEARLSAALLDVSASDLGGGLRSEPRASEATSSAGDARQSATGELDTLLRAVEDTPNNHEARLALAQGYARAGRADAAIAEYRALLASAPEITAQIADGLQALVRQAPRNPDAHRALGDAHMKIGRFQQAIDEYNQAVSLKA